MSGKLLTYVPHAVKVKIFGVAVEGYTQDNIFDIERDSAATTFRKAQDGSHTAFLDKYGSYRVVIYVAQSSESNTWLHLLFKFYQKLGLEFKMPIEIEDGSGGLKFTSVDTFFELEPRIGRGREAGTVEWTFICHNASYSIEGNGESSQLQETLSGIVRLIELSGLVGIDFGEFTNKIADAATTAMDRLKNLV